MKLSSLPFFAAAFLLVCTSNASPTFTQDGKIRFKTDKEIKKEAGDSRVAMLAKRAELKKQFESEIAATEAHFKAKKKKLDKELMKRKFQVEERHRELADEWEKMSHNKQDVDEAALATLRKIGDKFGGKK